MEESKVFVVILNWNNAGDTIECLRSVLASDYRSFQVVVCDNASTDDSVGTILADLKKQNVAVSEIAESEIEQTAKSFGTQVVLIRNDQNYAYAGGNNRGLKYALRVGSERDFVWVINNDTVVDPLALSELVVEAKARPEIGFFGSTILDFQRRDTIQTQGGDRFYPLLAMSRHIGENLKLTEALPQTEVEQKMGYVIGASVFVRLGAIKAVGLMEERYFLYFEEVDWAIRAKRLGLRFGYVPKSLVYHKGGATIGSTPYDRRKNELSDYYGLKNRLVVTRRLTPWCLPTVYLGLIFTLVKRLLTGQLDRVWMIIKIIFGVDTAPVPRR